MSKIVRTASGKIARGDGGKILRSSDIGIQHFRRCCCGGNPACSCNDLPSALFVNIRWNGQSATPGVTCDRTYKLGAILAVQAGTPPGVQPCSAATFQRWWKATVVGHCPTPLADFDIELACCNRAIGATDREVFMRVNGDTIGGWKNFDNCNNYWCWQTQPDLADSGDCDSDGQPYCPSGTAVANVAVGTSQAILDANAC